MTFGYYKVCFRSVQTRLLGRIYGDCYAKDDQVQPRGFHMARSSQAEVELSAGSFWPLKVEDTFQHHPWMQNLILFSDKGLQSVRSTKINTNYFRFRGFKGFWNSRGWHGFLTDVVHFFWNFWQRDHLWKRSSILNGNIRGVQNQKRVYFKS